MKKFCYYIINFLFLVLAVFSIDYLAIFDVHFSFFQLIILIILFLGIHLFKYFRISFILLEEMLPFGTMLKVYIKSTFVNISLPYKCGELFRIYLYGNMINDYAKSCIAVVIEKFFDAIFVCLFLFLYSLFFHKMLSLLAWGLFIFICFISFLFFAFKSTYIYLNRFLVNRIQKKYSIYLLSILEKMNMVYVTSKKLLSGRKYVIFLLTFLAWISEILFIYITACFLHVSSSWHLIFAYLTDSFFGISNIIFDNSIYLCTIIFLVMVIVIYVQKICKFFYRSKGE